MGNTAWRNLERDGGWKDTYKNGLLKSIKTIGDKTKINILLLGQVSAGKSSYMNNVATILKGRSSEVSTVGSIRNDSVTRKLKTFSNCILGNIRLFDLMGVEEAGLTGLNTKDVLSVLKGNVSEGYEFHPATPIEKGHAQFKENPSKDEKMHCVVFVVDANVVGRDNIPRSWITKVDELLDALKSQDIPRILLLTKIDVLCEDVRRDITKTYTSAKVKKAVDLVQGIFGFPDRNIFPVQNCPKDTPPDFKKDILTLLALRQMVNFAADYLEQGCFDSDDEDNENDQK